MEEYSEGGCGHIHPWTPGRGESISHHGRPGTFPGNPDGMPGRQRQGTPGETPGRQGVKFFKNLVIVKFQGIDDISQVETWRGAELYVERKDAVPLKENEYYIADLLGMKVCTEDGALLGSLKDVISTGANDVYAVDSEKYGEVLIPAIKQCIMGVDVTSGVMTVHLLPGLIDESAGGRENEDM